MDQDLDLADLLVMVVMILHHELSIEEIARTTGLSFFSLMVTIQSLSDLQLVMFSHLDKALPIFRISDMSECIAYLETHSNYTVTGNLSAPVFH